MDEGHIIALPQFKEAMAEVLEKHEPELKDTWYNPGAYTAVWDKAGENGGVYQSLADKLGMKWKGEYWWIDTVLFREYCPMAYGGGWRASFISVAVEHENDFSTSCQEINKLVAVNASLKVLVTYPGEGDTDKILLSEYAGQIQAVDNVWPGHSAQQRYVVIFGGTDDNPASVWDYYVYENGGFRSF